MKKVLLLFFMLCFALPCLAIKDYYIKKDVQYDIEFLCFSEDDCHVTNPTIIKINNKTFVGFGGYHYYDIDTYKYDSKTNTYTVDMIVDRDPSTDLGYYSKCPYDKGLITHLVFGVTYTPSKKVFKVKYKGFVTSKEIYEYENNEIVAMERKYLAIYYNTNPKLIKELQENLDYYNNEAPKKIGVPDNFVYDIELVYLIDYYFKHYA